MGNIAVVGPDFPARRWTKKSPAGTGRAWSGAGEIQRIIPAPTVLLLLSSMMMKAPVPRFWV